MIIDKSDKIKGRSKNSRGAADKSVYRAAHALFINLRERNYRLRRLVKTLVSHPGLFSGSKVRLALLWKSIIIGDVTDGRLVSRGKSAGGTKVFKSLI